MAIDQTIFSKTYNMFQQWRSTEVVALSGNENLNLITYRSMTSWHRDNGRFCSKKEKILFEANRSSQPRQNWAASLRESQREHPQCTGKSGQTSHQRRIWVIPTPYLTSFDVRCRQVTRHMTRSDVIWRQKDNLISSDVNLVKNGKKFFCWFIRVLKVNF
jgi:hypothetical protein